MAEDVKPAVTRDERIEQIKEALDKSTVGTIKGPSLSDQFQAIGAKQETNDGEADAESEETSTGGKKVRIPASRLKTLTSEIKELREKAQSTEKYEERIAVLESQIRESKSNDDEMPDWWKAAYGETEVSKQGYKNQQRVVQEQLKASLADMERQRERAEQEREERVQSIEASFDDQMDELEESLGRELTGNQKAEILDIVGDYSPMENDRYIAYLPIEKAYDIWNKTQGQSQSKKDIANIAGMTSSGSASSSSNTRLGNWRQKYGL